MFSKRTHLHWYTQNGMEQTEFQAAREDIAELEADYLEAESEGVEAED